MTRGPQQQRLSAYVGPADDATLDHLGARWAQGAGLLRQYAMELRVRSTKIDENPEFVGETADAAQKSFAHSAETMSDKAGELQKGSAAFHLAAGAVRHARTKSESFEQHAGEVPPSRPDVTPGSNDPEDVRKMHDFDTATASYWDAYHARETAAAAAIADLQSNHEEQAKVFQAIHGEPPPEGVGPPTTQNPVHVGSPTTPSHVPHGNPTHEPVPPVVTDPTHNDPTDRTHDDPTDPTHVDLPTVDEPGLPTHHDPVPTGPGVPQGPGVQQGTPLPAGPGLPGQVGGVGAVGGGAGAIGGVGAVAGGALGGAAAAGLAFGGLGGGLNGLAPIGGAGVRGSLSASGVRGIGATSRTGVGSVLGRGTTGAGRAAAGAGGMASRGGSRAGGSRGARGPAGSRGAGAGAGRTGKDKKRKGEERDLFDDGSDWIDDEDAAPGLID